MAPGNAAPRWHADDVRAAVRALGLDVDVRDQALVRTAYLTAIRTAHPDRNRGLDATERTAELTVAYRIVVESIAAGTMPAPGEGPPTVDDPVARAAPSSEASRVSPRPTCADGATVRVIADDTIEVEAPLDMVFSWLLLASHEIGDVTFLDRSAPLLQIVVQFVDEPVCQMIFDLQGRAARGTTEVFCTIDSIEDRPPPPISAVTALVADQLVDVSTW